jgi:hypothetical protein
MARGNLFRFYWIFILPFALGLEAQAAPIPPGAKDLPWEISNDQGETYLPDIYYAADAQNEQVMPTKIAPSSNRRWRYNQIDRLIYPTLGNPNLYIQEDAADFLTVVVRAEERLMAPIASETGPVAQLASERPRANILRLSNAAGASIRFFLMPKSQRGGDLSLKGSGCPASGDPGRAFELRPSLSLRRLKASEWGRIENVGAEQAKALLALDTDHNGNVRATYEFRFDAQAMKDVCPGLYDVKILIDSKSARSALEESQYNAVRVFKSAPKNGEYTIINVSDSQVTVADDRDVIKKMVLGGKVMENHFEKITNDQLRAWVDFVNQQKAAGTRGFADAAFITFNGDLHNGGSPLRLKTGEVAGNYNNEAIAIIEILRDLEVPIFLTPGNHDGYVAMAATLSTPAQVQELREYFTCMNKAQGECKSSLNILELGDDVTYEMPPEFSVHDMMELLAKVPPTKQKDSVTGLPVFVGPLGPLGGKAVDVFAGRFVRLGYPARTSADQQKAACTFRDCWIPVPSDKRNVVLYDGFYQWRRTYGPLYSSFRFGQNFYVNLNTYDLRQHRRSGWGMYTVNYGGGLSEPQMEWFKHEVANNAGSEIVLLSHHDPRGGHNGKNFPYYFRQVEYSGVKQSLVNYVKGEVLLPQMCRLPDAVKGVDTYLDCMHDGLQEWMRPDPLFDCEDYLRFASGPRAGECDQARIQQTQGHSRYSGYQFLNLLALSPNIRTLLIGHTHYNSVEMKFAKKSDQPINLVPRTLMLDAVQNKARLQELAALEMINPMRRGGDYYTPDEVSGANPKDPKLLSTATEMQKAGGPGYAEENKALGEDLVSYTSVWSKLGLVNPKDMVNVDLVGKGHDFVNELQTGSASSRDLAILRVTAIAELTSQRLKGAPMAGFSVLDLTSQPRDSRQYTIPQVNRVTFFQRAKTGYLRLGSLRLDRTTNMPATRLENISLEP